MAKKQAQVNPMPTAEVVKLLGCSCGPAFHQLVKQYDLGGKLSSGQWDPVKLCKSIQNRMKRGKTLEAANQFLRTAAGSQSLGAPAETTAQEPPPPPTKRESPETSAPDHGAVEYLPPGVQAVDACLGLESAVTRLRTYEKMLADRFEREMGDQDGAGNVAGAYRDWISAVEQMRKSEADLLDVLARRKQLVDVDAVREWAVRMVETTKGLLLVMPTKLAGELEGMDWPDIQARLDAEIRDILTNLSACPDF